MIHQITEREAGQRVCLSPGSETEISDHFITIGSNSHNHPFILLNNTQTHMQSFDT